MCSVGNKWSKTLSQHGHLFEDLICIEALAAVSFDDAIRVFEISFDARTKHVGHERVGGTNTTTPGFVFVRGTDAAQCRPDLLVAEPLFARVVQGAVIRKDEMCARADLDAFR